MLNNFYCESRKIIFSFKPSVHALCRLCRASLDKTSSDQAMRFIKEMYDIDVIDTGVKSILDHGKDGLLPHFIYSGEYYYGTKRLEFREMLLTKMKSYRIQSAVLTKLTMWRRNLVTKETVKKAYKGAMKTEKVWNRYEGSINDDLETFFMNLQDQDT